MNVLYLIHHAGQGGTERYVLTLAQKLREDGRITPFFAYTQSGLLSERMEALGVPTFEIPMPGRYSLKAARAVAALCREKNIHVIHTQFLRENYIALLSRLFWRQTRVVYTNHLILGNNLLTRLSNRLLSPQQHVIIAVCTPGKAQMIRNGIPERKITVIHNAVDPDDWIRPKKRLPGLEDAPTVLLYAARLVEGKGHMSLIDALSRVRDVPYRLLLAGDGPLRGDVLAAAEQKGVPVTYLGFCEDMPSVLASADININAAGTEACSFNILESMAAGLPQIAANAGGNGDLIDGENGLLFPYGDADAMAITIRQMLTDSALRGRCAERAGQTAQTRFHIKDMLSKTMSIYQEEDHHGKD